MPTRCNSGEGTHLKSENLSKTATTGWATREGSTSYKNSLLLSLVQALQQRNELLQEAKQAKKGYVGLLIGLQAHQIIIMINTLSHC